MSVQLNLLRDKETALLKQLKDLRLEIESIEAAESIVVNDIVDFTYGRGPKARNLRGKVVARDGNKLAILTGEGVDAELLKVFVSAIVVTEAEPQVEQEEPATIPTVAEVLDVTQNLTAIPTGLEALENV